jgi:hypothetical protein
MRTCAARGGRARSADGDANAASCTGASPAHAAQAAAALAAAALLLLPPAPPPAPAAERLQPQVAVTAAPARRGNAADVDPQRLPGAALLDEARIRGFYNRLPVPAPAPPLPAISAPEIQRVRAAHMAPISLQISNCRPVSGHGPHTACRLPCFSIIHHGTRLQATLPNGLRLLLLRDPEVPLVRGALLLSGGQAASPGDKVGLASITASLQRAGGSRQHPAAAMDDRCAHSRRLRQRGRRGAPRRLLVFFAGSVPPSGLGNTH